MPDAPESLEGRSRRARPGSTTERILSVISIAIGASNVLFLAMLWLQISAQWENAAVWWNLLAIGVALVASALAVAAGLSGRARVARVVASGIAISYLVVVLLRIPASELPLMGDEVLWHLNLAAVAVTAAAVAYRAWVAVGYLIVCGAAVALVRWACGVDLSAFVGAQNGVQTIAFCSIFLVMVMSLVRAGQSADGAIVAARRARAAAASGRARAEVTERINALIHDRVLATLLLAGRATDAESRAVAARSAADAIEALELQRRDSTPAHTTVDFVWTVQGLVRDTDPEAQFGYEIDGSGELPNDVGDALASATLEALRNSLRHAGSDSHQPTRAVHVDSGADRIVVTVLDDGVGFDTERPSGRLGIASSIRGRMRAVGGRAQIASVVGQGTRVALTWDRAAARQALAESNPSQPGERPWRTRRRVSPLDLDFWIGPDLGHEVERDRDDEEPTAAPRAERAGVADVPEHPASRSSQGVRAAMNRQGLAHRMQREPLLIFAVVQNLSNVALAFMTEPALAVTWPSIVALALYFAASALVALPSETPLRGRYAFAILLLMTGVTVAMTAIMPPQAGYFAWHIGANTLLLLGLALRGRIRMAWLGMFAMLLVTTALVPAGRLTSWEVFWLFDRNIATLLVGSVAALVVKRTINQTLAVERETAARAASEAATAAGALERERVLQRFEASALPMLQEIAAGEPSTDERRREWLTLEAELRDRIRARALDVEPLRSAIQRARARGVRVVVLDDAGGRAIPADEVLRVLAWASERIDADTGPEITVRLRALNGGLALTIVGERDDELVIASDDLPDAPARRGVLRTPGDGAGPAAEA